MPSVNIAYPKYAGVAVFLIFCAELTPPCNRFATPAAPRPFLVIILSPFPRHTRPQWYFHLETQQCSASAQNAMQENRQKEKSAVSSPFITFFCNKMRKAADLVGLTAAQTRSHVEHSGAGLHDIIYDFDLLGC